MLTGTTIFTSLINTGDATALLVQFGYVFGGLIAVMLLLSPIFIAKYGFNFILAKVTSLFGGGVKR